LLFSQASFKLKKELFKIRIFPSSLVGGLYGR